MKVKGYQTYRNILILILVIMSFFLITKTLAVSNPYLPGQTQDPACGPGDPFCTVTLGSRLYTENPNSFNISNQTRGTNAIAIGTLSNATGNASIAIGHGYQGDPGAEAEGQNSVAIGQGTYSGGLHSSAIGPSAVATGDYSTALGYLSSAFGNSSTAIGYLSEASGDYASALGEGTFARSFREIALGSYPTDYTPARTNSWSNDDRLMVIGIGQDSSNRANALTVMKNGNVGIGNLAPEEIVYSLQLESGIAISEDGIIFDYVFTDVPGNAAVSGFDPNGATAILSGLDIKYLQGNDMPSIINSGDLPSSIRGIDFMDRKSLISHNRMVPLLIRAIQELDQRIVYIESMINSDSQQCKLGSEGPECENPKQSGSVGGGKEGVEGEDPCELEPESPECENPEQSVDDEPKGGGVGGPGISSGDEDEEEGGGGRAQVIQASNDLNLTNILLIIASLLLLVNVVVGIRRNER